MGAIIGIYWNEHEYKISFYFWVVFLINRIMNFAKSKKKFCIRVHSNKCQ